MFNKKYLLNGLALAFPLFLGFLSAVIWWSGWNKDALRTHLVPIAVLLLAILGSATLVSALMQSTRFLHSWKFWLLTFAMTLIVSLRVTEFSFAELFDAQGSSGAFRLFNGLFHANLRLLPEALIEVVETLFVAFLATAVAIPLAFLLAFLCARNIMQGSRGYLIYVGLRTVLNVTRSIEPLIWAVIFSVWVGIGPFAGMLALMIHSVASLAKQYSEIIEGVDQGPVDAVQSTGANRVQIVAYGIVPQVILPYIAFTFYRWDINVRMATVIGLAGGGGIGTLLLKYQGQAMWNEVGCIILVIASVVWIMDSLSAQVREALK